MVISLGRFSADEVHQFPYKSVPQQRVVTKLVIGRVLVHSAIIQDIVFVDGPSSRYPLMYFRIQGSVLG